MRVLKSNPASKYRQWVLGSRRVLRGESRSVGTGFAYGWSHSGDAGDVEVSKCRRRDADYAAMDESTTSTESAATRSASLMFRPLMPCPLNCI